MPLSLLWLTAHAQLPAGTEWQDLKHDFEIIQVATLSQAAQALGSEKIRCTLVAGPIPGSSAMEILEVVHGADPLAPIVILDPEMTAAQAVQLIRNGAYHCFGGRDSLEALRQCLHQACDEKRRREKLRDRIPAAAELEQWLVGESRAIEDILNTIRLIGPRRCTVLITGETGTGKEMAARALHMASPRASLPMVAVNCSALPENLLEAELFGHVKGAFTGASNLRIGRFEQAHRSTVFLDEIGEMPIELQTKLLRVLQEREIQRLGSSETIRVDVRVVAASNSDLQERIRQGKFREDLYYRLNVVPLTMPPLRQRRGDIPMLVDHFVAKVCRNEGIPVKHVTPEAKERLQGLPWPGNVRQLENMVEMAIALSGDRETLGLADLGLTPANFKVVPMEPPVFPITLPKSMDFDAAVGHFERSILEQALTRTGGNKTAAAELLGLKRTTLIMKLRGLQDYQAMLERAG
jgi:DNA-binding NtrC family response regulator